MHSVGHWNNVTQELTNKEIHENAGALHLPPLKINQTPFFHL